MAVLWRGLMVAILFGWVEFMILGIAGGEVGFPAVVWLSLAASVGAVAIGFCVVLLLALLYMAGRYVVSGRAI